MRRQQLANVLDMLPEQNQILTKYLISFLVRVSSYASDNLMTAANLATVRLSRSLSFYLFVFSCKNWSSPCVASGVCAQSDSTAGR